MGAQCSGQTFVQDLVENNAAETNTTNERTSPLEALTSDKAALPAHELKFTDDKDEQASGTPSTDEPGSNADSSESVLEPESIEEHLSFQSSDRSRGTKQSGWSWSDYASQGNTNCSPSALVSSAHRCFEVDGDVVTAFKILTKLQASLLAQSGGAEEWRVIVNTPEVKQLIAECDKMKAIGHACCSSGQSWVTVYKNAGEHQYLDACFDPSNPYTLQYRLDMVFPVNLKNALAITSEVELQSNWNAFLVAPPKVLKRTKGTHLTVSSQASAMMGMIKNENLDDIFRYIDEDAGIVVEHIRSVQENSPMYSKPSRGFKSTDNNIQNLWVACGSDHTILRQTATLGLPIPLTKTLLSTIAGLVGKYILSGLIRTANRSLEPGNLWEEAMEQDVHDFYRRLDRCVQSEASQKRCGISGGVGCDVSELSSLLDRHKLQEL